MNENVFWSFVLKRSSRFVVSTTPPYSSSGILMHMEHVESKFGLLKLYLVVLEWKPLSKHKSFCGDFTSSSVLILNHFCEFWIILWSLTSKLIVFIFAKLLKVLLWDLAKVRIVYMLRIILVIQLPSWNSIFDKFAVVKKWLFNEKIPSLPIFNCFKHLI
jgi:hypothetical protein